MDAGDQRAHARPAAALQESFPRVGPLKSKGGKRPPGEGAADWNRALNSRPRHQHRNAEHNLTGSSQAARADDEGDYRIPYTRHGIGQSRFPYWGRFLNTERGV